MWCAPGCEDATKSRRAANPILAGMQLIQSRLRNNRVSELLGLASCALASAAILVLSSEAYLLDSTPSWPRNISDVVEPTPLTRLAVVPIRLLQIRHHRASIFLEHISSAWPRPLYIFLSVPAGPYEYSSLLEPNILKQSAEPSEHANIPSHAFRSSCSPAPTTIEAAVAAPTRPTAAVQTASCSI